MEIPRYVGQVTAGPSYDLWQDCPVGEILQDPNVGIHHYEDFTTHTPTYTSQTSAPTVYGHLVYGDDGVVIAPAALQGGGLKFSGNDADNDEGHIQNAGSGLLITDTASTARKLWFEGCLQKAVLTDDTLGFFLGLLTPGLAADLLVDTTAAMAASKSYLGFLNKLDDGDGLDIVFADASHAVTEFAASILDPTTGLTPLIAATDFKVGFKFDLNNTAGKYVRFWINGVEYTTDHINSADFALTNHMPDDRVLAPTFLTKVNGTAEQVAYLKWWRWAQLR